MINVMFWNAGVRNAESDEEKIYKIEKAIVEIIIKHDCDIVVLAEFNVTVERLRNELVKQNRFFKEIMSVSNTTRVKIIARDFFTTNIIRDSRYYVIHDFEWTGIHFLLAAVHLPSKLHNNENQRIVGRQLIEDVTQSEKAVQHEKIFIIGDFNASPYEELMSSFEYMHAIYDAEIVHKKKKRTVCGDKRSLFYNPMWNMLGDNEMPKGSYYYDSASVKNLYWHIFDQVLMSADCIEAYRKNSLEIITDIGQMKLAGDDGVPDKKNYSDHLPVFFSFQEELL